MDEVEECPPCKQKIAAWVMTFADLMSLLMCFFVLLLSFSEMDALKFKRLAGSMAQAFGVQNVLNVSDIPKGTSIIAQEFSPGRPDPTPINEIWQKTTELTESSLDVACLDTGNSNAGERGDAVKLVIMNKLKELIGETEQDALTIASALSEPIKEGLLEVETEGRKITIRVKEKGSFKSGSATLSEEFLPTLAIIRQVVSGTPGMISIEGHTDSVPIKTREFASNWALSSARAVSVAHGLFEGADLHQERFSVKGYAETRPLVANDTPAHRARNRRVEIVISQGLDEEADEELNTIRKIDPALFNEIKSEFETQFRLSEEEIF
ncbi:MAG: flagellar motor protein MotB [Pseudomonadales bacterium]|nr:flagellar motor protein MotB [Pseudomonadales bacterium]